jgi:TPR repeat protein
MKSDERFNQACHLWEKQRVKEAFRFFLAAAEDGDEASQTNVGYFYDCGIGTKKDTDAALRWYTKAHRRGDSAATLNIETVYLERGENSRALRWFESALKRGNAAGA